MYEPIAGSWAASKPKLVCCWMSSATDQNSSSSYYSYNIFKNFTISSIQKLPWPKNDDSKSDQLLTLEDLRTG